MLFLPINLDVFAPIINLGNYILCNYLPTICLWLFYSVSKNMWYFLQIFDTYLIKILNSIKSTNKFQCCSFLSIFFQWCNVAFLQKLWGMVNDIIYNYGNISLSKFTSCVALCYRQQLWFPVLKGPRYVI